jgi:ABC-type transport system involved in cytochrome c biogenesis permease subunit
MRILLLSIFCLISTLGTPCRGDDVEKIRALPVQDNGRVKPLDSLARESVEIITGKSHFGVVTDNADGNQAIEQSADPVETYLDWQANPGPWESRPVLYVPLLELRAKLSMRANQQWIAPNRCRSTWFKTWVGQLAARKARSEANGENAEFTRLEMAAQDLQHRLELYDAIVAGDDLAILPVPGHGDRWLTLHELRAAQGPDGDAVQPLLADWDGALDAFRAGNYDDFNTDIGKVEIELAGFAGPDYHRNDAMLQREVFYNHLRPFLICGGIYLLALLVAIIGALRPWPRIEKAGLVIFGIAVVCNIASIALRCSITGWAPVTNIYETVVWVAMASSLMALALRFVYERRILVIGGCMVALAGTLIADNMPAEFGSSIRNLTPVLRSNVWLSTHVLTIVSSYAAFALALVLGNIVLGQFIFRPKDNESINHHLLLIYRSVQIGVLLVAAGTILGGLWADVSWGRFWGWDPKEVWALIVLLVYVALLHGRFSGWIGRFGLAAGSVICFTAVLMSWYGVNFVLGVGLHSYGFGTGGQIYVAAYVLAQWVFVLVAWIKYRAGAVSANNVSMRAVGAG